MSPYAPPIQDWQTLGQPPPSALIDARHQLHWAVQVAASLGYTLVKPTPDWSHSSLDWLDDLGALASQPASAASRVRTALRLADLTLLFLDETSTVKDAFSLAGHTLDDGYAWLTATLKNLTGQIPSLVRSEDELPAHPVAQGAAFSFDSPAAFAELSRWYANAHRVLHALDPTVRTWPHHFDMAVLLPSDPEKDADETSSIGIGLVPGDHYYAEPYWYITPGLASPPSDLPPLQGDGHWHTEEWFGAVLTGSTTVAAGSAEEQAERVQAFVYSGVAASRMLLATAEER